MNLTLKIRGLHVPFWTIRLILWILVFKLFRPVAGESFPETYQFSRDISFNNQDFDTMLSWSILNPEGEEIRTCANGVNDLTENDELVMEVTFQGVNFGWIGLALSEDDIMQGSDGVIGVPEENSVTQYSLLDHHIQKNSNQDLLGKKIMRSGESTTMSFKRELGAANNEVNNIASMLKNNGGNIYILMAKGDYSGSPQQHARTDGRTRHTVQLFPANPGGNCPTTPSATPSARATPSHSPTASKSPVTPSPTRSTSTSSTVSSTPVSASVTPTPPFSSSTTPSTRSQSPSSSAPAAASATLTSSPTVTDTASIEIPSEFQFTKSLTFGSGNNIELSWSIVRPGVTMSAEGNSDGVSEDDNFAVKIIVDSDDVGWIGVAFNDKDLMRGADGIIGAPDQDFSSGNQDAPGLSDGVAEYSLVHHDVKKNNAQGLLAARLTRSNGKTTLAAVRALGPTTDETRNLASIIRSSEGKLFMLIANGPFSGGVNQHERGNGRLRAEVNVVEGSVRVVGDDDTATIVHGFFMTTAWGVLVPVSLSIALFMKHWEPQDEGSVAPWLKAHVILQITAVILTLAGIITQIADLQEWLFNSFHTKLGTIVFSLAVFQVLNGFLRADKNSGSCRRVWEILHILVGAGTASLSIVAIVSGLLIANAAEWVLAAVVAFVAVWIIASFLGIYLFSRQHKEKTQQSKKSKHRERTDSSSPEPSLQSNPLRNCCREKS
eukprot:gb/GECG01010585.1/.p1 GENE.gb/GECG01010585.1/~~gb/GECG01010585.1/.p1  ORF type:complete len:720 (+),score=76.51 gb/GECG01010585.1/:1-2160(+)